MLTDVAIPTAGSVGVDDHVEVRESWRARELRCLLSTNSRPRYCPKRSTEACIRSWSKLLPGDAHAGTANGHRYDHDWLQDHVWQAALNSLLVASPEAPLAQPASDSIVESVDEQGQSTTHGRFPQP